MSVKRNYNFYVFLGKKYLEENEEIELHALGNAISHSVMASENLVRNGYASIKQIKTETITVPGDRGDSKKAKLFIILTRSPDFKENMAKFDAIRRKNEELEGTHKVEEEPKKE